MMQIIRDYMKIMRGSLFDIIPILLVIIFFQIFIFQKVPENIGSILIGIIVLWFGLGTFLLGLQYGIFPIGEKVTGSFINKKGRFWLYIFSFLIGFGTTIAEPALTVVSHEAGYISLGRIDPDIMRYLISFSVGFALVLGVWRIIYGFSIHYLIIGGYVLVVLLTYFTPKEIIGLSYDLGGVVAADVTVPLVAALGIGLASSINGRNPIIDGFGIIALASLTPMLFAQVYGIYIYEFGTQKDFIPILEKTIIQNYDFNIISILKGILLTFGSILPLLLGIFFFQYIILKEKISNIELKKIFLGLFLVVLGLYSFILGLEIGIIQIGKEIAFQLTKMNYESMIYIFAFTIGFSTTMAEPSLTAISKKVSEISLGKITPFMLRIFVAVGVAIGITLGTHRIIVGDSIHYYIMIGYIVVILLSLVGPKYIMPIAYDSGGVTTSTVSVPLITALGIGLASNTPGRDPLIDGFGLIAFASLFPMITVIMYGIYGSYKSNYSLQIILFKLKYLFSVKNIINKEKYTEFIDEEILVDK
ncbi:DUF1538 domain-containing protein [Candidatus Gracilibacteria bacterium]|nr:DUF1538 domain-containing protein [Candidatus Gracilibacteria bacterium]